MNEDEFRADLLAAAASRAESQALGLREAFVAEMLERLRDAGELPDAEHCPEKLTGNRGRHLEIDAFAFDDADESLHLIIAVGDRSPEMPPAITLSLARDQGFNRLLGVFEQAREGWLSDAVEESRPIRALAKRIREGSTPAVLRLSVLTDRPINERLREIPSERTREDIPVSFQIWDVTRLKRIHEARSVRDDLVINFSSLQGGGLALLPASEGDTEYRAFLAALPGETLADIYIQHGSRLLEGNVRTFLGRRGNVNKGIAQTLSQEPARFFAYNNGIAATASAVSTRPGAGGSLILEEAVDLQIVNGAQTTASLAGLRREGRLPAGCVFVPMKLSVVLPEIGADLIPLISRYSNKQNSVRDSDFFANHPFHRRMEEISRRVLAPAVGGSQVQTHWYYERARGQYLNDQAGLTPAARDRFLRMNPRHQVITKTDLGKVESCFDLQPDVACKGAEKSFTAFAERVAEAWNTESQRSRYGDDWYRGAAARVMVFRATERVVSEAKWYEGGYRAQVVAYTVARLSAVARELSAGGSLDYMKIWNAQVLGDSFLQQLEAIGHAMMQVLLAPPLEGQNISEWAKQQACRKRALETPVEVGSALRGLLLESGELRALEREDRRGQRVADGLAAVTAVLERGSQYWTRLRDFAESNRLVAPEDSAALALVCAGTRRPPNAVQASRLLTLKERCEEEGFPSA